MPFSAASLQEIVRTLDSVRYRLAPTDPLDDMEQFRTDLERSAWELSDRFHCHCLHCSFVRGRLALFSPT